MGKPKAVNVKLIDVTAQPGKDMEAATKELIRNYHPHLAKAQIALAWNLSWNADVDGFLVLGKCKKGSDLDRELHGYDFVILLNQMAWGALTAPQRVALIDHELCHAEISKDQHGHPKIDERGRIVYRTRKHDLEEFKAIYERHGMYKENLADFVKAQRAKHEAPLLDSIGEKLQRKSIPDSVVNEVEAKSKSA